MAAQAIRRDIVVVGASAGGVDALQKLVGLLPPDFAGSVFVVLHIAPTGSALPSILGRATQLPVVAATDGETIQGGRIYVAPPDRHLVLEPERVRVIAGPRQNGHRPAIDPLFRTAAWSYGRRVAGVILSGVLDDGTLGCRSIKEYGGLTLVQEPREAIYSSMPQSAIDNDSPDLVAGVSELARVLVDLSNSDGHHPSGQEDADPPVLEVIEGERDRKTDGQISPFTCPECSGTLWEIEDGPLTRYRCRVGHSYSQGAMAAAHGTAVEAALWTALRTLEEHAALKNRLATRMAAKAPRTAKRLAGSAAAAEEHAAVLRQMLDGLQAPDETDEPVVGGVA